MPDNAMLGSGLLILACAAGYAVAAWGMKLAASDVGAGAVLVIVLGLGAATACEIAVLRHYDLGLVYVLVLALEAVLILTLALMIGEGLGARQLLGAVLIGAGLLAVAH